MIRYLYDLLIAPQHLSVSTGLCGLLTSEFSQSFSRPPVQVHLLRNAFLSLTEKVSGKHQPAEGLILRLSQVLTFALFLLAAGPARAQSQGQADQKKMIRAVFVEQAPHLDGDLSDDQWNSASLVSDFVQQNPLERGAPSERTEVRIVFTDEALYIGAWCYDSRTDQIIANDRRRDADMLGDDGFWLVLDPFHSHRDSYFLRINPLGTQWDALVTDEGRLRNTEWDGRWEVKTLIHSWGYSVEIKIPFKILRFPASEKPVWGIDFKRWVRRKNESMAWSNYRRDFAFLEVSQAGHLVGLSRNIRNQSVQVKPYIAGGTIHTFHENEEQTSADLDLGIENLRWVMTPRLKLDTTINPDFAQAEVDDLRINLTRFPLFFEERREFFLEDAGLFEFGARHRRRAGTDLILLHTRRIGLTEDREPVPILYGTRFSGQFRAWNLSVMNVQQGKLEGSTGDNVGAYRFKMNLLSRSSLGAMATHKISRDGTNNATVGVDLNFIFLENLRLQSFAAKSKTTGEPGDGWAVLPLWLRWDSDRFYGEAQHLIVEEDFNPAVGFVARTDIRKSRAGLAFKPRPSAEWLRQLEFSYDIEYLENIDRTLLTRNQKFGFNLNLENGDSLQVGYLLNLERQGEDFLLADRILVPAGSHRNNGFSFQYSPYDGRKFSGFFQASIGDFWGGRKTSFNLSPNYKWSDQILIYLDYDIDRVELPQGSFTSQIVNSRFEVNLTNQWLTSLKLQYDRLEQDWGINFRLNYIYRPGDDLFFVVNRVRTANGYSWSVLAKLTHTFDF